MDSVQLTEDDIDGASLEGRAPKQLTCKKLRFWLSCRGVNCRKLKTKAELVARVQDLVDNGQHSNIIDPTEQQLYEKRKLKHADKVDEPSQTDELITTSNPINKKPLSGWERYIPVSVEFDDIHINDYVKYSGKQASKLTKVSPHGETCIKPVRRGHQFYSEQYLHDIWCQRKSEKNFFCGKCFASQKKNDKPHDIWCVLDMSQEYSVCKAMCTCTARLSGYCNHVLALLYQIRDFSKSGVRQIPEDLSRTSRPQAWHKPRIEGIVADPVMQCSVSGKEQNSLYEARDMAVIVNDDALLQTVQHQLHQENPLYGLTYMASSDNPRGDICRTVLGTYVPKGSVLSYQLSLTEGNFNVECDPASLGRFGCRESCIVHDETYPSFPLINSKTHQEIKFTIPTALVTKFQQILVSTDKATEIETKTTDQSLSDLWFAEICHRKKKNVNKLVQRLQRKPLLSQTMPKLLEHGKDCEKRGIRKYLTYMKNIGHKVTVQDSGFVVNPMLPFLGCSPDGKVIDPIAHPYFGIVEVKCPYTCRQITPKEAAQTYPSFCLHMTDTLVPALHIKRDHDYYYQIQGQMAITGARWCDFVVYTFKGLCIQRVPFDATFWADALARLQDFYFSSFLPNVQ